MTLRMPRRNFLKGVAAAGAAAGVGPFPTFAQAMRPALRVGINAEIASWDPHHQAGSIVGNRYYGLAFDQLVRKDLDGSLIPMLATSWVADGTTWRFDLREGVRFHDGSVMTADDVVFSLERLLFSEYESAIRPTFTPYVREVRATGPLQIEIVTPTRDPLLPRRIATPFVAIMPRAAVEAAGFDAVQTAPIGAGPYKVEAWDVGSSVTFTAHEDYWMGTPPLSELTLNLIPENATRVAALQAGEIDVATTLPPDLLGQVERTADLQVADVLLYNFMHVYFNTVEGVTANPDVRRALALGIDRGLIADALWGGRVAVMRDYYLPSEFGYDPDRAPFPFEPDAATAALDAAGYAGEPLAFTPPATYYTNGRLVTDAINEMWQAIGVNVEYEPLELAQWAERSFARANVATLQSFGTGGDPATGFIAEYLAENWIAQYYPASDRFKALAREAASTLDEDVRYRNYRAIADILDRDVPFTPLYQSVEFYGMRSDVRWRPHPNFFLDFRPDALEIG
ncbi:MAG: ABC transporter substrate-binding protein [Trueperaceae bacterium]|nr:ABC transporter substrate-binding protein [Trueperaceae bacterium]